MYPDLPIYRAVPSSFISLPFTYHARRPSLVRDIAEGVVRSVGFQL